jgi:hypothetical protein
VLGSSSVRARGSIDVRGTVVEAAHQTDSAFQPRLGREAHALGWFGGGAVVGDAIAGPHWGLAGGLAAGAYGYYRARPRR